MYFGLGAVTWSAGPTHGVGLAVRATVDLLFVYTTTFRIHADYNTRSKQMATGLVGYWLSERHTHQAASPFCLVLDAHKPTDFCLGTQSAYQAH